MKWRNPRLWIALASSALVVSVALVDTERTSPGPLSAVHGRDPALMESSSCDECHGGWFESMTDACLACHEPIEAQIDGGSGLHGALERARAGQCALCHSEHHGSEFAIVNRQSFAQAGIPDPTAFDHELVGWTMQGKHLEQECAKCHRNADVQVLPEGATRFIGLDSSCVKCHEDKHESRLGTACADCHTQGAWTELLPAGHERALPLTGGHADVACRDCHAKEERHSLEVIQRGIRQPDRTCAQCHESPHADAFVDGNAALSGMTAEGSCVACHRAEHDKFREPGLVVTPEQHEYSGFPLVRPHEQVACEKCHAAGPGEFGERYPGRSPDTCAACHADPHGGQFADSPFNERGCLGCHERVRFEPPAFTVETHERANLRLEGTHREVECDDCHVRPAEEAPRTFRGTPSTCAGCHDDAHGGFFDAFLDAPPDAEGPVHADCASCHRPTKFREVPPDRFDHARWTGFAVRGAHAQESCELCHRRAEQPDERGRAFGRVEEQFGVFQGCVSCHRDPHRGGFDGELQPSEVEGRTDCARCHVETSFRAFPDGFDHGAWTGFALDGAHGGIGCTPCHAPRRPADELGRTWEPAAGDRCASCHDDVHAGQFASQGMTDCEKCHNSAEAWSQLAFRHNLHSRFRLDEAHDGLACGACHKSTRIGDAEVVRYRPLGMRCSDCHAGQEDPLRRRKENQR